MDSLRAFSSTGHTPYAQNVELALLPEVPFFLSLMRALDCLSTGMHTDGLALLASAREQLPPGQEHIVLSINRVTS